MANSEDADLPGAAAMGTDGSTRYRTLSLLVGVLRFAAIAALVAGAVCRMR